MKKRNYIAPTVTIVNLKVQHSLMAGSEVGVSSTEYNESTHGSIRSRRGSFWDDEEDE